MQHSFKTFQQRVRAARNTRPAKAFYASCALAGLHRGWTQSKKSLHGDERLFVDRFAWGALYAGLYAWGHPIVFYCLLQQLEIGARKLVCGSGYKPVDNPNILKILDVPHAETYNPPCFWDSMKAFEDHLMMLSRNEILQRTIRLEI